jgi:hypothetical protein
MSSALRISARLRLGAFLGVVAAAAPAQAFAPSGGAGLAGLPAPNHVNAGSVPSAPAPAGSAPVGSSPVGSGPIQPAPGPSTPGTWLRNSTITEYWPAPESWFVGRLVSAPGLSGRHRIDWLYSAWGVSMQGSGLGLDGRAYHINALGNGGWVTAAGLPTWPANGWAAGTPYWRAGEFWRNPLGQVTFPLAAGGWSAGPGRRHVPLPGVSFAAGASLSVSFYQSIAVDPRVIPLGSRVYIPAYQGDGYGGWFVAQDTGGAITGHHVDVYRSPPAVPGTSGQYLTNQRIFIVKPHR